MMNRASVSAPRPLSLTEELEKLEQSITLTLQEIDHNFSRAHRIVTSSILPIVEQYAEHSNAVWEGSKFWKQFFEASANVSLSGVEERDEEDEDISYTQSHENASTYATSTSQPAEDTLHAEGEEHRLYSNADESLLENADISGSTPRVPRPRSAASEKSRFADYSSQYEALKEEIKGGSKAPEHGDDEQVLPATPGSRLPIPDMTMTPTSSPFDPTYYLQSTAQGKQEQDPLLHRVLDKNYRIQQTPLTTRRENRTPANKPSWHDTTSPMSSPPAAVPQLHAEIFSSPVRQQYNRPSAPRTPGVSVQPPKSKVKEAIAKQAKKEKDEITWESDSDEDAEGVYRELGMSPPKTIQFSLPQSRLLQTPAREASKRIVEDLLLTAGAGLDSDADSPSVVALKDDFDYSF